MSQIIQLGKSQQKGRLNEGHPSKNSLGKDHRKDNKSKGNRKNGQSKDHPGKDNLGKDDHPRKDNLGKDHPGKDNLGKDDHPRKDNLGKDHPGKDNLGKDHPGKDNLGKDHPGKDNLGKDHPGKDNLGDGYPGKGGQWIDNLREGGQNKDYSEKGLHGWILYAGGDNGLNGHYINLYQNACQRRGMSIELGFYNPNHIGHIHGEDTTQQIRELLKELPASERPTYVVNRTRDYRLAEAFESLGICVFNNSQVAKLGNDKAEAYRYMQQRGVPVLPTVYGIDEPPRWYPAILKSCGGHGGTEVSLIRNESEWMEWKGKKSQKDDKKKYVMQQAASEPGKDVRVYVVGNRIVAAVLRTSKTDFRSNLCLGGSATLYRLSDREHELAERTMAGLSIGMAGIDFIFHHGEMAFNEIEDVVGARGLYSLTDYDIVDEYVGYIQEKMRRV